MKTPKIYLETTVFNFLFADDAPDKKADTVKLFEEIKEGKYLPYTSAYVLQEINAASAPKKTQMLDLIREHNVNLIATSNEATKLASVYVKEGIIPQKYVTDALHIATATIDGLDFVVSYNFKHIVKRKTILMTGVVNLREGYKQVGIFSPTEVIDNDNE